MIYEIREGNVDNVCFWLSSELKLSRSLVQAIRETAADPHEVLLGLLYEAKRLAREHGLSGDDLLMSAMSARPRSMRRALAANGPDTDFREVVRGVRERQLASHQTNAVVATEVEPAGRMRLSKASLINRVRRK